MSTDEPSHPTDDWIRQLAPNREFADVGGLWGLTNQRVVAAARAGARSVTMIDITEAETELWREFREHCAAQGVDGCRCISSDVHAALGHGPFDVVHCSGVLYHCPHPLQTLLQLRRLCRGSLLLGTTVIPSALANDVGTIVCEAGGALFVPSIGEQARRVAAEHFHQVGAQTMVGLDTTCDWKELSYEPWWWLFTPEHISGLLDVAGFTVREIKGFWSGRAVYIWADAT